MEFFEVDDGVSGWMVVFLFGAYLVMGLLYLFGLLAPLGGWIVQQHLLGILGPASLLGLVVTRFLRRKARWLVGLPCCWAVACWLAPFLSRITGMEGRPAVIGSSAIIAMGMLLPVLLDWQGRKAADQVQVGGDGSAT